MIPSRNLFLRLALPAVAFSLASCGTMKSITAATGEGFGKVAAVAKSPFGPRIPIVEAREGEMREVRSGHELAVAYRERRRGFRLFGGPVDFTEPELPDEAGLVDGGLLPELE